jgi:hypothetical protein
MKAILSDFFKCSHTNTLSIAGPIFDFVNLASHTSATLWYMSSKEVERTTSHGSKMRKSRETRHPPTYNKPQVREGS